MVTVAALFVERDGVYAGRDDVEVWDVERDARTYEGPHPVVAHPPCARWSLLAGLVEARYGIKRGEDGGCFAAALEAVRRWGGVLEHPAESAAWTRFELPRPPRSGGWVRGLCGGWACRIEQAHYGHRARKATWLYAFGCELPTMAWGDFPSTGVWVSDCANRARGNVVERMGKRERLATPPAFAELLLSMARSAAC